MTQKKLSPEEAHQRAITLWKRGVAIPLQHFQRRMRERNVTMNDVQHLLINGEPSRNVNFDEDRLNYRYMVKGTDVEQEPLALVYSFDEILSDLYLITVM